MESSEVPVPEGFEVQAVKNARNGADAREKQLQREREDLQWQVPEMQWDAAARASRQGAVVDNIAIPERPCLSVPKISQPLNIVRNQMQGANMGIQITPLSADSDADTAEIYQDLYRSIERDPDAPASHARNWAFDRALQAGTGWYRVNKAYDPASDDPFDQKLLIERILYQDAVIMDPSATKADYSDAGWAFLTYWKPLEDFKREWPDAEISGTEGFDVDKLNSVIPGWAKGDAESKAVQVGEYFFKHYRKKEKRSIDGLKKRDAQEPYVCRYVVAPGGPDGFEILEKDDLNSPNIPLIPVLGQELQPFDEERRIYGMVRPARDSLKIYNYATTNLVESVALLPKAPYTLDPRQIEGYENSWKQANTRTFPYLPAKAIIDGQLVGMPQRTPVDASSLTPSLMLLQQADEMIQASSATPDPVLGKSNKNQSGKAIERLQSQSEASNSGFIYNFAEVTLRYEAKVVMGMIPQVYDKPGRIVHVTNIQGDVRKVMLNAPFVLRDGKPVQTDTIGRPVQGPAPMSQTPPPMGGMPSQTPPPMGGMPSQTPPPMGGPMTSTQNPQAPPKKPKVKFYDFSKGIYGVTISIGKSYASQMQEASDQIGMFIEKDPSMAAIMMPMFLRNQTWSGHSEAADLAKQYRAMQFPDIGKEEDGEETVEDLKAQIQQLQQQIQQGSQANEEMQKQIDTESAKAQAGVQKAQIEAQAKTQDGQVSAQIEMKLAEIENQAKMQLEQMKAESDMRVAQMKEEAETQRLMMIQQFEAMQAEMDRRLADKASMMVSEQLRDGEVML